MKHTPGDKPALKGGGMMEYKTVDTRTLAGLRQAERLKAQGWTVGSVGLYTIQFYIDRQ